MMEVLVVRPYDLIASLRPMNFEALLEHPLAVRGADTDCRQHGIGGEILGILKDNNKRVWLCFHIVRFG